MGLNEIVGIELDRLTNHLQGRVVIVGVGNRLKGDDGFGPAMIERLRGRVDVPLFDCGTVPENYIEPIRREQPQTILVLDAADFSARPGTFTLVDSSRWGGGGFSSHSLSLKLFADMVMQETETKVMLLAIQPQWLGFGDNMSPEVIEACRQLERWLKDVLKSDS
jgi:hydrogenase 3 maturation protease